MRKFFDLHYFAIRRAGNIKNCLLKIENFFYHLNDHRKI